MLLITNLGALSIITIFTLIIILLLWKKHKKEALSFVIVLFMCLSLNYFLKLIIHRPRPLMSPLIVENSYSFPSGHAMNTFVFYALIAYYYYHFTRHRKKSLAVSIFCAILILLIGFSRIYLGVHYPTDVLAGYLIGFWWFITAILIYKSFVLIKLFETGGKKPLSG